MLHIQNIRKLIDKNVMGGWKVTDANGHPTMSRYIFTIECFSPIGRVMNSCTISLDRRGELQRNMNRPDEMVYFFNYNGDRTKVCGTSDWLGDMDNFVGQLKFIIENYHNIG